MKIAIGLEATFRGWVHLRRRQRAVMESSVTMSNLEHIRMQFHGEGEEPLWLIRRGPQIRALCLCKELHPRIAFDSVEVWIEDSPLAVDWAQRLALEKGVLPVYTADAEEDDYRCIGLYYVLPRDTSPEELSAAETQVPHSLSRIIYLSRAQLTEFGFAFR
jgi:hypothetical protein